MSVMQTLTTKNVGTKNTATVGYLFISSEKEVLKCLRTITNEIGRKKLDGEKGSYHSYMSIKDKQEPFEA